MTQPLQFMRQAAMKNGKVQYPMTCGCTAQHFQALCQPHREEVLDDQRRFSGMPALTFTHRDVTDLPRFATMLHSIKLQLIMNPTKSLLIKIIPENNSG